MTAANGVFHSEVAIEDGEYGYAIFGVLDDGNAVVASDRYEELDSGNYVAALHVTGGKATITFDPLTLAPQTEPRIAVIEKNADNEMVARVLASELKASQNDLPRARILSAKLKEFEVVAIVGDKVQGKVSSKAYVDKTYLLELWATWCAPCAAELPKLHDVYARYNKKKGKHLNILSISIDETPAAVAKFRADKAHPMPWSHGNRYDDRSRAAKAFFTKTFGFKDGAVGVPFYVLVDHGQIVAASPELSPDRLPEILDRLLP